jgi:hypothetical protein
VLGQQADLRCQVQQRVGGGQQRIAGRTQIGLGTLHGVLALPGAHRGGGTGRIGIAEGIARGGQ